MADYAAKIAQARKAGYSDAEIVGFLSKSDQKVQQAKAAGYNDADIIGYLSPAKVAAKSAAPPAAKPAAKSPAKPTAGQFASGLGAALGRGLLIADELQGATRAARNVLAGESKVDPVKLLGVVANYNNPVAAGRAFEESGAGAALRTGMAQQRAGEDRFTATNPKSAALARGTGNALTMLVPGGQVGAAMQGGRAMNMLRGATAAAAPAAAMSFADRGNLQERLGAANQGALVGGLLGAAGGALAKTPPKPKKVSPEVELLASEGVRMTPGQMSPNRLTRSAEDAGTSLPMLGDEIAARRIEGFEDFNRATLNRALKPIGEKLPDDVATGTQAVKFAGDKLSKGYEDAIPGRNVRLDPAFSDDVRTALEQTDTLTDPARERLLDILTKRIDDRIPQNGMIDGRTYKKIQSELDYEVSRFSKAQDPDQRAIGDAIANVQTAFENAARRQDPAFAKKIDALDQGWAELARIETAAAKSQDMSGVFTPAQYRQAILSGEGRIRKRGVARGEALSQDLASAALKVLPSKMPDSGTAGRAAWGMLASAPGAALGALTGGGPGALAGIGGTAAGLKLASKAYSPEAIQAANTALNARISNQAREAALAELRAMAAQNPALASLYQQVASRLGVATQQNMLSASVPR